MWRLRTVRGAASPGTVRVTDGLTIGRAAGAGVVVRDDLASRMHARLEVRDDGVWITDLGSANGTEVDGRPVQSERLPDHAQIRVGDTILAFEPDEGTQPVDPPASSAREARLENTVLRIAETLDASGADVGGPPDAGPPDHPAAADGAERLRAFAREAAARTAADAVYVLVRATSGGPYLVAARHPESCDPAPPPIPRSLLAPAASAGRAILIAAESRDRGAGGAARPAGTAMCAPLRAPPGGAGDAADEAVCCVERADPLRPFTTRELLEVARLAAREAPALAAEFAWFRWRATVDADAAAAAPPPVLVGESPKFVSMLDVADHVARARAPVVIHGARGSGRRTLARLLHEGTAGERRPFLPVLCGGLPPGDEEAALFGRAAGARRRPGLFEDAGAGTVCLVEVTELPAGVQDRLAAAIAGTGSGRRLRCRIVATTDADLRDLAREGSFSRALATALTGVTIGVPDLEDRRGDVALLARHFAAEHGRRLRGRPRALTDAASRELCSRRWRGQVAELSNAVERAVLATAAETIDLDALTAGPERDAGRADDLSVAAAERGAIDRALARTGGHRAAAAKLLGISRPTLTRKIRDYGIDG